MISAFLYLASRSFKNRVISQLRRLKRPKYLVFALIGGAYFYLVAGRHWINGVRFAGRMNQQPVPAGLLEPAAALLIVGSIVVAWCAAAPISPLTFSEAEIQYLFPAPVPRRRLVQWKLLRGQLGVLVSLILFTAICGPYLVQQSRAMLFAGAWLVFATMQLHLTGIRMARHALRQRGIGWATRSGVTLSLLAAAIAVCAWWAASHVGPPQLATLRKLTGEGGLTDYVDRLFGSGPLWVIALLPRLLVRPALSDTLTGFLLAAPAAAALLAVNYVWVVRFGVVLEEGALAAARRLEEIKEAHGRGRMGRVHRVRATPAPFRLAPTGRPEVALVWKNLVGSLRNVGGMRAIVWMIAAFMGAAMITTVVPGKGFEVASQILGTCCAMSALALLLVGPSILRGDFRQDLMHIDMLKTYPLRGPSLLVGSLLAPVMVLTILQWGMFGCFAILTSSSWGETLPARFAPALLALTGAILAPPMNMVAALIHNTALLLIPGWVTLGPVRTTGVERIGQGMITTLGFMLAMALTIVPAAIIFGITYFFVSVLLGLTAALPVSALPATLVLAGEAWVGAAVLGAYLERFDPSRELDSLTE